MGGMQALQWAVSYPTMMDSIVPIIPLGRTTAWKTSVLEMLRQSIMADPKFNNGNYPASEPPQQGMRLWAGWLSGLIVRTPGYQESLFPNNLDAIASLKAGQDAGWRRMDAVDWIYQSWAYDQHSVGTSPGFNGDYAGALKSIKAKTLILAGSGDLLNPEYDAKEVARYITNVRYVAINESRPDGAPLRRRRDRTRKRAAEPRNIGVPRRRHCTRQEHPVNSRLKQYNCVLYVVRSTWHRIWAHRALRQLKLGTSFPVIGVTAPSLGRGFRHVFTLFGLAIPLVTRTVIDLGLGVDPNLSGSTAGSRSGCHRRGRALHHGSRRRGCRRCRRSLCRSCAAVPGLYSAMTSAGTAFRFC